MVPWWRPKAFGNWSVSEFCGKYGCHIELFSNIQNLYSSTILYWYFLDDTQLLLINVSLSLLNKELFFGADDKTWDKCIHGTSNKINVILRMVVHEISLIPPPIPCLAILYIPYTVYPHIPILFMKMTSSSFPYSYIVLAHRTQSQSLISIVGFRTGNTVLSNPSLPESVKPLLFFMML